MNLGLLQIHPSFAKTFFEISIWQSYRRGYNGTGTFFGAFMISGRCMSVCVSVRLSCNVGVLWPNGWMHQDDTWYVGMTRHRPHFVG